MTNSIEQIDDTASDWRFELFTDDFDEGVIINIQKTDHGEGESK
jgi:hypothetical protein